MRKRKINPSPFARLAEEVLSEAWRLSCIGRIEKTWPGVIRRHVRKDWPRCAAGYAHYRAMEVLCVELLPPESLPELRTELAEALETSLAEAGVGPEHRRFAPVATKTATLWARERAAYFDKVCREELTSQLGFIEPRLQYYRRQKGAALHREVVRYNWDDGLLPLFMIVRSPRCWLSTALLIYWRGGPHFYRQYRTVDPAVRDGFDLLEEIVTRVKRDSYAIGEVAFDPTRFGGEDLTRAPSSDRKGLRPLPAAVQVRVVGARGRPFRVELLAQ